MKKAGIAWELILVGLLLFIAYGVYDKKTNGGVLKYAKQTKDGVFVKDINGQEYQAEVRGDELYVNDKYVGRLVKE